MDLIVASKNPVKINAVSQAFQRVFPDQMIFVSGVDVSSGVNTQPLTTAETLEGANNRVNAALNVRKAEYYVGLEGGVHPDGDDFYAFAWVVISDGKIVSKARTGSFLVPPPISQLIREGVELGEANDRFFRQCNSKQQGGAVALLSNNVLDRTTYYEQAVILALFPFINSHIYQANV